jgi:hypothetical protein
LSLERLRQIVITDSSLTERLAAIVSEEELFAEVKAIALRHAFTIGDDELADATRANRRLWLERWTRQ